MFTTTNKDIKTKVSVASIRPTPLKHPKFSVLMLNRKLSGNRHSTLSRHRNEISSVVDPDPSTAINNG